MIAPFKKGSKEFQDISTLMIGNGFALVIPVLVSPIISRMYGAEEFGIFTIYLATVSLFSSFATGRYDYAILIAKSRQNAQHLFKTALFLAIVICTFSLFLIILFRNKILQFLNVTSMGHMLYLVPLNILLFAVILACQNGLNRENKYQTISISKTIRSVFAGALQVLLGALGFLSAGLIVGKLVGDLFSSIYLTFKINKIERYLTSKFSWRRTKYLLKKYDKYLKINAPHALLNNLSFGITPFLLGYYFNEEIVGYFGLSYMVCIAPVQLIGRAFFQVFSQKISMMYNDGINIRSYTKSTIIRLFTLAFIPFTVLTIFGPDIFQFIFGDKWITAGKFVQILAPFLFIVFLVSPMVYIPLIYNEHKKSLLFEIALITSRVTAIIIGAIFEDVYLAILLFSLVSIIVQLSNLTWIFHLTKKV